MMQRFLSGTGILPVRTEMHRGDAGAIKIQFFRFSILLSAFLAVAAMDPPTQPIIVPPEQAAKEGRALVEEMLSRVPEANSVTGTMAIRKDGPQKSYTEISIRFQTIVTATNLVSLYQATQSNKVEHITIVHVPGQPNIYYSGPNQFISADSARNTNGSALPALSAQEILVPFAGSDFSVADLGLEFLHWPDQKLLQKEMRRSRSCRVLESTNPHPTPGGYSKVKSWVDAESDGILYAEAYDLHGKEIKDFAPKGFSKASDGQWQLEGMQISNVQTKSTTTVKFDVKD